MAKYNRKPTVGHFICYIRACANAGDFIGSIAALQEMEMMGLSINATLMTSLPEGSTVDPNNVTSSALNNASIGPLQSIKRLLLNSILKQVTANNIDELYFTLVHQVKQGGKIPRLVLDVMVEAFGRVDLTDRSFEIFQDYVSVFNVVPNIHSYNSLLASVACARMVNIRTLLTVFQEIETPSVMNSNNPYKPDSKSFSILFEAIADTNDFQVLDDILNYLEDLQVTPSPKSLRKLMVALAKENQVELLAKVTELLVKEQGGRNIPAFLHARLEQIKSVIAKHNTSSTTNTSSNAVKA